MSWGLFPDDVVATLRRREWDNTTNLRGRMLGDRPFPIEIGLRPPSGARALEDFSRFKAWIDAWKHWAGPGRLRREERNFPQVGRHLVPTTFTLTSVQELAQCLGADSVARSRHWDAVMRPLLVLDRRLRPALVRNVVTLDGLTTGDAELLARVLPQLSGGMARDTYLRALPIHGVDTKFLESHEVLITALLDQLHGGEVSASGGLRAWLGCRDNPRGWLQVRPLCPVSRRRLAGLSILSLPTDELLKTALPAQRILIVENMQSGLALPPLRDVIAVFGGGRNLAWTRAPWLAARQVAYWGDIDTWGLKLLGDARQNLPGLQALMMNEDTLSRFIDRTVLETQPYRDDPAGLDEQEAALVRRLLTTDGRACRLEQERIDADYAAQHLQAWAGE